MNRCPRCENPRMKTWEQLNEQEREVVKRLPRASEYSEEERCSTHMWCTRCWYESTTGPREA